MYMVQSVECEFAGETKVLGENLPTTNPILPGMEPGPPQREAVARSVEPLMMLTYPEVCFGHNICDSVVWLLLRGCAQCISDQSVAIRA
jgi:hypothetical protein